MKSMLLILILCSLCMGFSMLAANSRYGEESSSSEVREAGMGHSGTALADSLHFSSRNPATLGAVKRTLFMFSHQQEFTTLTDPSYEHYTHYRQRIPHLGMAFPLGRLGNAGVSYVDHLRYDHLLSYGQNNGLSLDTLKSAGSLYSLNFTFARSLGKLFHLGFSYNLFAGKDSLWFVQDYQQAARSPWFVQSEKSEIRTTSFGLGMLFHYRSFNIGAALKNGKSLSLNRTLEKKLYYGENLDKYDAEKTAWDFHIPTSVRIGLSGPVRPRVLLCGDLDIALWHAREPALGNTYNVGLGSEFRMKPSPRAGVFRRSVYRVGFHHCRWNHDNIIENSFTLGMGLPIPHFTQLLNVALESGQRGLLSKNSLRERYFKIQLGIRASGRWGYRPASKK